MENRFYYIAKGASVPIVLDIRLWQKQIKISKPYVPTDNMEKDFAYFDSLFKEKEKSQNFSSVFLMSVSEKMDIVRSFH